MKIIGRMDNGFIVTASEQELAEIAGFRYSSSMKSDCRPEIGREIRVSKLFEALRVSRERKEDIEKLANDLRRVAGRVDSINQALSAPIIEVEVKS